MALFAPYRACGAAHVEVRCFPSLWERPSGVAPRRWYPVTEEAFARAARDAALWRDRFDVYMGVLPRVRGGGKAEHLRLAGWIWADIDAGTETVHEALALLTAAVEEKNLPRPHLIVLSGGGCHAYWRLCKPVPCRERADQERLRRVMKRLVLRIGGELSGAHACPRANDAARILRLPGTFNHKIEGRPRPVNLLRCDTNAPAYPLVWWEANLPAEPLPPRPAQRRGSRLLPDSILPPATVRKLSAAAPDGCKHYTMVEVAVAARKRDLGEGEVRHLAAQVALNSGVPLDDPQQQRHLDQIVDWTMRTVQPDYSLQGTYRP